MNEIEKIGIYSTDEILEFMTEGEGRGFLGRSMFDAMYFKIKDLQSKIDKAIEVIDLITPELWNISNKMTYRLKDVKNILKEDK